MTQIQTGTKVKIHPSFRPIWDKLNLLFQFITDLLYDERLNDNAVYLTKAMFCKIENIVIENYGEFRNVTLSPEQFTSIVGNSSQGKSAFVEAVGYVVCKNGCPATGTKKQLRSVTLNLSLANGATKLFKRLTIGGYGDKQKYTVNGNNRSRKTYKDELRRLKIDPEITVNLTKVLWGKSKSKNDSWEKLSSKSNGALAGILKEVENTGQAGNQATPSARANRFNGFLQDINRQFGPIYRSLTGDLSAKLFLKAKNPKDPFKEVEVVTEKAANGDPKFVSFALLLAINKWNASPFVVFDNINQLYDLNNAHEIVSRLKTVTQTRLNMQVIGTFLSCNFPEVEGVVPCFPRR